MVRSLLLIILFLAFLGLGIATPFVMTLGYVWVDTFRPQEVAYFILPSVPVALIMGGGAVVSYFALDRRSPPPLMLPAAMQVLLIILITASLTWAQNPVEAWIKWDVAVKTMIFAAFIPLVIRSRVQIEAFAQTYVFSLAANFVPFGLKVLVSGGGYGQNLGLQGGNGGLAEGGQLSTLCLMAVPLALFLGKHGRLIPRVPLVNVGYFGMAMLAILTAIGTYERSALVGMVILGIYMFMRTRRKAMVGAMIGLVAAGVILGTASDWSARIATTQDYKKESSAATRILVWQWTLGYVAQHPLGGSFDSFIGNTIVHPADELNPGGWMEYNRAFHSIYFEVLGEFGWPGLAMFLTAAISSLVSLRRLTKKCRKIDELIWVAEMSDAVQSGMLVFLSSGAFVGIAFQPMFWYFVAMGLSLRSYVWYYEKGGEPASASWRRGPQADGSRVSTPPPSQPPAGARPWRAASVARPGGS